jgi:hypothetical protein
LDAQTEIGSVELPWRGCLLPLISLYYLVDKAPLHVAGSVNSEVPAMAVLHIKHVSYQNQV